MDKTELILKVLLNEATNQEVMKLNDWIALNDSNRNDFENVKLLFENKSDRTEVVRDEAYHNSWNNIKSTYRKRARLRKLVSFLAIILVVFSFLSIAFYFTSVNLEKNNKIELLKFNRTPISEVIFTLERKYEIEIIASPDILNCEFTGSFYNDSALDAIQSIAESMNFEYSVVSAQLFRLNGSGCIK